MEREDYRVLQRIAEIRQNGGPRWETLQSLIRGRRQKPPPPVAPRNKCYDCNRGLPTRTGERAMNVYQEFLSPGQCLLLLIDIQGSMLDLCVDRDLTVSNTGAFIEVARVFNIPVLCTVQNPDKLGGFLPELTGMISAPEILGKMEFNCFENEQIARAIRQLGRKTLILAGIEGHVCIFHTAVGALRLGYHVHIARDAVTSRHELDRKTGNHRMDRAGAVISSTEMIIFELLHQAGTKEFRALLPLLKRL